MGLPQMVQTLKESVMVLVKTQQEVMGQVAIEWTDEELVAMTMAGDHSAFDELVKRYSCQFHRVAWGLLKNDHEAEDIVQTAFYNMCLPQLPSDTV